MVSKSRWLGSTHPPLTTAEYAKIQRRNLPDCCTRRRPGIDGITGFDRLFKLNLGTGSGDGWLA